MPHRARFFIGFARLSIALSWVAVASIAVSWVAVSPALAAEVAEEEAARPAALGVWKVRIAGPMGTRTPTVEFFQDGKRFKGIMRGPRQMVSLKSVKLEGNSFEFKQRTTLPMVGEVTLKFSGDVDGNDMTGVVKTPQGEQPFTGKRKKKK